MLTNVTLSIQLGQAMTKMNVMVVRCNIIGLSQNLYCLVFTIIESDEISEINTMLNQTL